MPGQDYSKNQAWSREMAVALSKETFEKLRAGSEVPFRGASRLCYSSFFGQLQSPVSCLGLLLPLDIYVQSHTVMLL